MNKNNKKSNIEINYDFYSEKRWNNWIEQIKNSKFTINTNDEKDISLFINVVDDIILSCLKIAARFDKKYFNKNKSLHYIFMVKKTVLKEVPPISKDIDLMLLSIQNSLQIIFSSFECYIYGNYDLSIDINSILEEAIRCINSDNEENLETIFELFSIIGALIIAGKKLDNYANNILETANPIIFEWFDGLEAILISMEKTDNYKNFDEEE